MDDYVTKPVDPKKLAKVTERWIGRLSRRGANASAARRRVEPARSGSSTTVQAWSRGRWKTTTLLREVVACFLEDAPRLIEASGITSVRGDSAAAGAQAHGLKGAAANVGGVALSETALEVERAGQAGRLESDRGADA